MSRAAQAVRRWFLPFAALLAASLAVPGARAAAAPATVAVLYFDYDGPDPELWVLRKGLAQMIGSDLVMVDRIQVVERDRLEEVLGELDLQQSRRLDPASAVRVGKLLGARYLVFGSYFQLNSALQATARVVEVETGKVLYALNALGPPDDFLSVEQKLSLGLSTFFATKLPVVATTSAQPKANPTTSTKPGPRPVKPPKALKMKDAKAYASALDAIDKKDKATAVSKLKEVIASNTDFPLAEAQLAALN